MSDEEKIKSFADMIDGIERLTKPIQEENIRLHEQIDKEKADRKNERKHWLIACSLLAIALILFIVFAYAEPSTMEQGQNFEEKTQTQIYSEGAANGS